MPNQQDEFWRSAKHHTETIRSKLFEFFGEQRPKKFFECGQHGGILICRNCDDTRELETHCSLKWCPRCQHRVVKERSKILSAWSQLQPQLKFVTLTQLNTTTLTRKQIRQLGQNVSSLRREKVFENVNGGCLSIEVTNGSAGWHLHAHALVNARWIDAGQLAVAWGKLVGQSFAVVKVKDAREIDYAKEVSKYVCKPASLAKWPANEIGEFITAVSNVRMFRTFGTFFAARETIAKKLEARKEPSLICECGCDRFQFKPTFHPPPSDG